MRGLLGDASKIIFEARATKSVFLSERQPREIPKKHTFFMHTSKVVYMIWFGMRLYERRGEKRRGEERRDDTT